MKTLWRLGFHSENTELLVGILCILDYSSEKNYIFVSFLIIVFINFLCLHLHLSYRIPPSTVVNVLIFYKYSMYSFLWLIFPVFVVSFLYPIVYNASWSLFMLFYFIRKNKGTFTFLQFIIDTKIFLSYGYWSYMSCSPSIILSTTRLVFARDLIVKSFVLFLWFLYGVDCVQTKLCRRSSLMPRKACV